MHEDLFSQAETLAKLDAKKPKQANLRRAVSSAYYAVFHYLVHEPVPSRLAPSMGRRRIDMHWAERSPIAS